MYHKLIIAIYFAIKLKKIYEYDADVNVDKLMLDMTSPAAMEFNNTDFDFVFIFADEMF